MYGHFTAFPMAHMGHHFCEHPIVELRVSGKSFLAPLLALNRFSEDHLFESLRYSFFLFYRGHGENLRHGLYLFNIAIT